jgi:hypothetical protein
MQFVQRRRKFFVALGIFAVFVTNHSVAAVGGTGALQLIGHKHENKRLQPELQKSQDSNRPTDIISTSSI